MSKKKSKSGKSRPQPKPNRQIPNSLIRRTTGIGFNPVLQQAREFPLHGCWIMEGWEEGITPIVVARTQETGRIMFGVYMVDLYCLGVKNVYIRTNYSLSRFERELPEFCIGNPIQCSVELAHEIIYGSLEYAEKLGFQPHSDFKNQMADLMLDPPDSHPRVDHVSFGKDGKPFFVSGPYDDQLKCKFVIDTLMRNCGEGNFDYLIGWNEMFD